MTARDPKKFDPARAHLLDAPERERYLPTAALVDLLELGGEETVVDYGARCRSPVPSEAVVAWSPSTAAGRCSIGFGSV